VFRITSSSSDSGAGAGSDDSPSPTSATDHLPRGEHALEAPEGKKVKLRLVGLDGNAFYLLGRFQEAALEQGWTQEEVGRVLASCMESDYDHLLSVLIERTEEPEDHNGE